MRAILFDVDGVLLDSAAGYRQVWSRWCEQRGLDIEKVWAATHGRRPIETVAEVAAHLDPLAEQRVLADLLTTLAQPCPAFPGASQLLSSLSAQQWGVVTSGQRSIVLDRFAAAGIPLPAVLIDGDAVHIGKPDPEGYLTAAAALGADPKDCLVVEDAPSGVAAGKSAGMRVVAVATTHQEVDLTHADVVTSSLDEVAPHVREWLSNLD